eukprot:893516-Rhodomonas_salina.1
MELTRTAPFCIRSHLPSGLLSIPKPVCTRVILRTPLRAERVLLHRDLARVLSAVTARSLAKPKLPLVPPAEPVERILLRASASFAIRPFFRHPDRV